SAPSSGRLGRPIPFQAIVVPLLVLSMLPLPLVTIRSAGFGFGTLAAPLFLLIGLALARHRRQPVEIPYAWLFVVLMTAAIISVINSWLFWDPNVGTSMERGFGHRWIGYQMTALYFVAIPFLAFAAGAVYAQVERLTSLYVGVHMSVTVMTVLIWSRWRSRGLVVWLAGLGLAAIAVQETLGTIVAQRLGGNDLDRIGLWHSALIVWSKSPIIGVGAGNLVGYMERFSVFSITLVLQGYQQAHNIFLELLAELGVVGLALFLFFMGMVIWRLARRVPSRSTAAQHIQATGLAMLVGSALLAVVGSGIGPTIASAGWA